MPPQPTNIPFGTERDAAGLELRIARARAARLNASIATLDDALSEKEAAGPPAALTRSALSLLERYWRTFRRRRGAALSCLSDRELMDIGLTRDEIDTITPQRAIDRLRDSATYLWSRGVI